MRLPDWCVIDMSKFRLVVWGGRVDPVVVNDHFGAMSAGIHYARYGLGFLLLGIVLGLLTPCIALPSRFGFVEFQYSEAFMNSTTINQYFELLLKNSLIVLKYLKVDVAPDMPKPSPGFIGVIAITTIAVLDLAAAISLGLGVVRIARNVKKMLGSSKEG